MKDNRQDKSSTDWRLKNSPPLEGCLTKSDGVVPSHAKDENPTNDESQSNSFEKSLIDKKANRNSKNYFKLPYNPNLKDRAKELRKAGNLSEVLFWNEVKCKQFKGLDFDRQKIIGNYIVDFYCTNYNVVIEIDGSSHDETQEYDIRRDTYLEQLGITVIHIPDIVIKKNLAKTMEWLFEHEAFKPPRQ